MEITNLFSGLIGALAGVISTLCLYWYNRYSSAKRNFSDKLIFLKHDVWYNCDDTKVFEVWNESLKDIWILYNAFVDVAPPRKRKKVTKAWGVYKGIDHKIMETFKGQVFDSKLPPKNREEFLHKITILLETLEKSS
jgi:hypothetical protein